MSLIRFIFWSIVFYFLLKMFRAISKVFRLQNINEKQSEPIYHQEPINKINDKDIIEAEYEDLTPPKQN